MIVVATPGRLEDLMNDGICKWVERGGVGRGGRGRQGEDLAVSGRLHACEKGGH